VDATRKQVIYITKDTKVSAETTAKEQVFNVSSKKLPAEYLDRATAILQEYGSLKVAGLGNAATTAMKVSFILERLGYRHTEVRIMEKMMPKQKWVPSSKDSQDGEWVTDTERPARPVPQLIITLTKV
jgi:hypothetical protein